MFKNEFIISLLTHVLQGGPGSLFIAFTIWLVLHFLPFMQNYENKKEKRTPSKILMSSRFCEQGFQVVLTPWSAMPKIDT